MRYKSLWQCFAVAMIATLSLSLSGCGTSTEPTKPEDGSIEAYLQEHPEESVDDPEEAGSEEDENAASGE